MLSWMVLGFQDSASLYMSELLGFHDYVMVLMSGILVFIVYLIVFVLLNKFYYKGLSESTFMEVIWSVIPAFVLIFLVFPSMKVLYLMEDVKSPFLTMSVLGHQWYWSYVIPLFKGYYFSCGEDFYCEGIEYESVLSVERFPRLLSVFGDLFLPVGLVSRFLVSSEDVIHSFAIPALGVKVDALPGRINQVFVFPSRVGIFYGQCSEICGSNHSFMPIALSVLSLEEYDNLMKDITITLLLNSFEDDEE